MDKQEASICEQTSATRSCELKLQIPSIKIASDGWSETDERFCVQTEEEEEDSNDDAASTTSTNEECNNEQRNVSIYSI